MISLTILDEDALMLCSCGRAHHNMDILDTRGLTRGPVDTRCTRGSWDVCQVQLQVSDLSEEHVCRYPALVAITLVLITVNQTKSSEACSGFDDGHRVRIADELCEIVVDDRRRDQISSCREVYNGRRCGRSFPAGRAKSTAITDSRINSSRVVSHAVACTTR